MQRLGDGVGGENARVDVEDPLEPVRLRVREDRLALGDELATDDVREDRLHVQRQLHLVRETKITRVTRGDTWWRKEE